MSSTKAKIIQIVMKQENLEASSQFKEEQMLRSQLNTIWIKRWKASFIEFGESHWKSLPVTWVGSMNEPLGRRGASMSTVTISESRIRPI
jgi:hypothetical protein